MVQKTKILIITDSPVLPTGMAETTRLIFNGLMDQCGDQYELHQIGLFHCHPVTEAKWPIYPTRTAQRADGETVFLSEDAFGQKSFQEILLKVKPDIVFAFNDPQKVVHLCNAINKHHYKLLLYLTFDGLPVPPIYYLKNADFIVTMSEFSRNVALSCLKGIQSNKVDYIYSPADVNHFHPLKPPDQSVLRCGLLPNWIPNNAFLIGWIGRNQWRKQVWLPYKIIHHLRAGNYWFCAHCGRVFLYSKAFLSNNVQRIPILNHPKHFIEGIRPSCCRLQFIEKAEPLPDVFLWLHMADEPRLAWPKSLLERQFCVEPGKDLYYTKGETYRSNTAPAEMSRIYQIWDVLLYLSGGEGFGIPAWEALCSGLPVIYTNYSSHAEYLNKANGGVPIGGILQPEKRTCIWRMIANIPQAIEAVRKLYFDRKYCKLLGSNGNAFVKSYTPEIQAKKWHQIFQRLIK